MWHYTVEAMVTQWHNEVWKTQLTTDAQFRVAEVILETVNTKAAYMLRLRDRADLKKKKKKLIKDLFPVHYVV